MWHWKDPEPQSVQIVRLAQERRFTLPAAFSVATKKLTRLGDPDMRTVQQTPNGKWAVGRLDTPYRLEVSWGGTKADQYRVNTETGERTLIEKAVTRTMGISPDSKWFLYLKDKHVIAYNLETGEDAVISTTARRSAGSTPRMIIRTRFRRMAWRAGRRTARSVILNHRYDLWQIPLDGGKAVNLTQGAGEAQQIRFRLVRFDRAGRGGRGGRGGGGDASARRRRTTRASISRSRSTLSAYGDWTKKSGYYQVVGRQGADAAHLRRQADRTGGQGGEGRSRDLHRADVHGVPGLLGRARPRSRRRRRSRMRIRRSPSTRGAARCSSTTRTAKARSCRGR